MSNFLPDDWRPDNQRVAESSTAEDKTALPISDSDRALAKRLLRPELFNEKIMSYIVDYAAVNTLPLPVSMIEGFSIAGFHDEITTSQTTTSTSYTNLATTGPTLTSGSSVSSQTDTDALPDGVYIIWYGFTGYCNNNNNQAYMSLSVNGAAAADSDAVYTTGDGGTRNNSISRATIKTLRNDNNNTIQAKYRTTAGTSTFASRFIVALRVTAA